MMTLLYIVLGVGFLYLGGEAMVRGAFRMALRLGVTALVAGVVVVSAATSLPELVSSIMAQVRGRMGEVALGNVIGSNIANVGLILGITALVRPVQVKSVMIVREMPLMIGSLVILMIAMWGDVVGRAWGVVLILLLCVYVGLQVYIGRREHEPPVEGDSKQVSWVRDLWLLVVGVVALVVGGYFLVEGAVSTAMHFGLSQRVIGLTIVAIGSSLPELAATLVAVVRRQHEIAIGNVIGSNVFNALMITGIVALIAPIHFNHDLLTVDAPVMLALSLVVWAFSITHEIGRLAGVILLLLYGLYLGFGLF